MRAKKIIKRTKIARLAYIHVLVYGHALGENVLTVKVKRSLELRKKRFHVGITISCTMFIAFVSVVLKLF